MALVCQSLTRATSLSPAYHHYKSNENPFSTGKRHQIRISHAINCVSQFRKCKLWGDNYMCNVFGVDILNICRQIWLRKTWHPGESYMWNLMILSYSPNCTISWSGSKISWRESFSLVFSSTYRKDLPVRLTFERFTDVLSVSKCHITYTSVAKTLKSCFW